MHINPYATVATDHEPTRKRKLLLHRQEIQADREDGREGHDSRADTAVFKNGHVKVSLALAKGKHAHDKRETLKRRDIDRETRAAVKERKR